MKLAMFVLDSVLFDSRHRQGVIAAYRNERGSRNNVDPERTAAWDAYWESCIDDTPLPALDAAAALLIGGHHLILTSGRPMSLYQATRRKVERELAQRGCSLGVLSNITYDLRVEGEAYVEKVEKLITGFQKAGGQLTFALIKNRGLATSLRRAWPTATICNVIPVVDGVEQSR